jgi:transposase InsO family protein
VIISMDDSEAGSLEQIRAFLAGSGEVRFAGQGREQVYGWVEQTLVRQQYASLDKPGKGLVRRYIARMTGLSRAQVTRLITAYGKTGRVKAAAYQRSTFATRYTTADVTLLAYVDKAHGNLSGPATRRVLEREYGEYGQAAYQRLAAISVAHLYRLRNSEGYRKRNASYQPTRPTPIPIGARRKPQPQGSPGYLRIDTVHQGDQDGRKGLYHINAVDQVTQWEIVAATPQISELWLMPVLEALLGQFPFVIRGFHSDNGSEFINYNVARLLDKLLIEQTKSRAHHTGDNGLVETKNGAIIRKHIGFGHIDAQHAEAMDQFHRDHLNPYLNFHRPCAVPKVLTETNGKRRRVYLRWATPFEMFRELPQCEKLLQPQVTLAELDRFAQFQSDTEAALAMQRAKRKLLQRVQPKCSA